jgi:multiple sugar transport system permease protein
MFVSSFKTQQDIWAIPPNLNANTLRNYETAFGWWLVQMGQLMRPGFAFYRFLINSLTISLTATSVTMLVGVPAAFGFSRFKGKFMADNMLFFLILTLRMAPGFVEAIPIYLVFSQSILGGTAIPVVLMHILFTLTFVVWLMKGFFDEIPRDLDDRARIDGCSHFKTFRLILPLVKPGLATTAIFSFIFSWNEFLLTLLLTGAETKSLPVAISGLVTPAGTYWGAILASSVIVTFPVLVFAIIVQKYLVRGLTFGAVK